MKKELDKKYNSKLVEQGKYEFWLSCDYFKPKKSGTPFSIVIPPPNVTGVLHLGHALDVSIQDVIIRYKKLCGYRVLWIPGTDHAGIATQTKFEAYLKKEKNTNRTKLGRIEFLKQLMEWKETQSKTIHEQWKKMGLCLDYSTEKFTMDKEVNEAVNKVFVELYNNNLIYRGKKMINWDVKLQTAVSDIEVIKKQTITKLYYLKYFIDKKFKKYITIATTRPETMFGDVCVFVHPDDKRYKKLIGTKVYNPANSQWIPVLADKYIDIEFGTGVMKCTPAHDFNDYALAEKYKLEKINIMNQDGTMNELAKEFEGLDRLVCRTKLVEKLMSDGFVESIDEKYSTQIGYSERTDEIIEPYISNQWFVKMKPLAKKVISNQKAKRENLTTTFLPKRFDKALLTWLNNIEDWCISRQLWWGHQLPIWYNNQNSEIYVSEKAPENPKEWTRDGDVLDTWFSSGLWPLVCLNWPRKNKMFETYFPTSILVTGYDILTFWVSRMMMLSTYFTDKTPFHKVYIHGLIRDAQGRKMSKSLGNGVDPMQVIDEYGADTLRLFLTSSSTIGEDLRYSPDKLKSSWAFLNKLWNSARYILGNIKENKIPKLKLTNKSPEICLWIIYQFNKTLVKIQKNMNNYNFVMSTKYLVDFIYNDFCSVFIELSKKIINNKQYASDVIATSISILKNILIILHPQCPFITEEIYKMIPDAKESIMKETWPEPFSHGSKQPKVQLLNEIITIIRRIRINNSIPNSTFLDVNLLVKSNFKKYENAKFFINTFLIAVNAQIKNISSISLIGNKITEIGTNFAIEIPYEKNGTKEEIKKMEILIQKLEQEVKRSNEILSNDNFITKAPKSKVDLEKEKLAKYQDQLLSAKESLKNLKG